MIGIQKIAARAVVLTSLGGFLCAGIFAGALPRQSAEAQRTMIALSPQHAGEASAVSVPRQVQFNGTLKDAASRPVSGVASVTFAIYAEQDGGTALWSETQNVLADANGHYNVLLGAATAAGVPAELFGTGQSRWLGVTVGRQQEMSRILLASVPYALKAADAETLGGLPASSYVTTQSLAARIATPGSTTILATSETAAQSGSLTPAAAPAAIPQAAPTGSGTTNYVPLWTSTSALGNSLLYQTGGKIGVGTTTPTETLDVNGNSIFRGSFQLPPGHDAIASSGYESHSFQFQASSYNSSTKTSTTQSFGFRSEPLNNNTSNPSAQLDLFFIPNGGSTFINTGVSWSSTGIMTFAPGQTFSGASETLTGSLNLPNTTSSSTGVIQLGGSTFINDIGDPSNTFVGHNAGGQLKSTRGSNTGIGDFALNQNTTGEENTAVGESALIANTTGSGNTGVGLQSMFLNTTGSDNIAVGFGALQNNQTGNSNIGIGLESGDGNSSGSFDEFLGYQAGSSVDGLSNATAIGAFAIVGQSNDLVLGGTGTNAVNVGIGTTTPQSLLEIVSPAATGPRTQPAPQLTLTNTNGGTGANVSLDFNTSAPIYGSAYNPGARIKVVDVGNFTDGFVFESNSQGRDNAGLIDTMTIDQLGNVNVAGTLTKKGGSFKIDDPIDPAGKYLSHSFVESPDMMNIYNGNVVTNAKGYAVVTMPAWFEALNGDFRYQLTPVGQFAQAMVASEIKDRKFTIRSSKPHVKISWQVTGIRHDAWAQAHRIPTEEEKPANEQGRYMDPELFGASPEQRILPIRGSAIPASVSRPQQAPAGAQ